MPAVTLSIPQVSNEDSCPLTACLQSDTLSFLQSLGSNPVAITVTASPTAGSTIDPSGIVMQYAPAGTGNWTTIYPAFSGSGPYTAEFGYGNFPFFPPLEGLYDLRAQVTDSSLAVGYSQPVTNVVVDDDYSTTYVAMHSPGSAVRGTVDLLAAPEATPASTPVPDTVSFQISPDGQDNWTTVGAPAGQLLDANGRPVLDAANEPEYDESLDTTAYPDGLYDLRVTAQDAAGDTFVGNLITIQIVNTPPTVTLSPPAAPLTGVVALSATATSAAGIASVRFQYEQSGTGDWTTIGVAGEAPYTTKFDTRAVQASSYDLRAIATDVAGNTATSTVSGITISNAATGGANAFSLSDTDVPATDITLLGELSGGTDHETWAFGYTSAPSATVAGTPLPFTADTADTGDRQLVLLRYTDAAGWSIADVLRNADGTPWPLPAGTAALDTPTGAKVTGAMAPTGEAWIAVAGDGIEPAVFHRLPGGQFLLDPTASATLAPLLAGNPAVPPRLTLHQDTAGALEGALVAPGQQTMSFGLLVNGTWSVQTAPTPSNYAPQDGTTPAMTAVSLTGAGSGWATFEPTESGAQPLMLGSFTASGTDQNGDPVLSWQWVTNTGMDALDLSGAFGRGAPKQVVGAGLLAASDGIWIKATIGDGTVIGLYDPSTGRIAQSWCDAATAAASSDCAETIDANDPAALPDAVFDTPTGPEALALGSEAVDVYADGTWRPVAAPGFEADNGNAFFEDPTDGWVTGSDSVGEITAQPLASQLTQWPQANQSTLISVALPPAGAGITTSGALAVGLDGAALHYDSTNGWLVDPVPASAQGVNLLSVAYDGPSHAVAVGEGGTILDWNGTSWSADPQSTTLTQNELKSVAFGADGEGWAVGEFGTILHDDGTAWSPEPIDAEDAGVDVTSVAVAGNDVFAVAGGNLITREADGSWQRVDLSALQPSLPAGSLTLVAGLPDGGVVAAGQSVMIVRQNASSAFEYSDQPAQGTAVALAAFRDPASGDVRAMVSVAPPAIVQGVSSTSIAGFPAGDGELLMQTSTGWQDLSRAQYPISSPSGPPSADGAPQPDPVLAVATSPDGSSAWAVGGYAGTQTAAGLGTIQPLQARPYAWQTATIWRFDQGGGAPPPTLSQATVSIPAQQNIVNFAFFSGAECAAECSQVLDAQPDVNLEGAAQEISAFAAQPGGPAFAMEGGNAVGPTTDRGTGGGAVDFANLGQYLAPLQGVPLYAAYGPLDPVPTSPDTSQPWADAFAQSPAPFGSAGAPSGITPISSGGADAGVNHYYDFDVQQNGGTLEVIVLDNSAGSLEASEPGQTAWLNAQLQAAQAAGTPVVVFVSQPLDTALGASNYQSGSASDGNAVATTLAEAGVLAVFTTSPNESDTTHMIPYQDPNRPSTGAPQIPEYEGAALGYQQTQNNGVLWYDVSVDTVGKTVTVEGIPVVQSLALEPLDGLTAARSSTLSFAAIGRRPAGTLNATVSQTSPQGYPNYVAIPSPSCGGCVSPNYTFTSSDPAVGNFVAPSGPGSQFPKLSASGKTTASSTSGLFCAFNPGETTVSVTSGLLTASLTVTVAPGNIGQPCGTVTDVAADRVVAIPGKSAVQSSAASSANPNAAAAPPATVHQVVQTKIPSGITPPPPPPPVVKQPHVIQKPLPPAVKPPAVVVHKPVVKPPAPVPPPVQAPAPVAVPFIVPSVGFSAVQGVVVPPIPPPITPVPPGGATAPAQSTAKREEKAKKEASQSAYVTRPAGVSAEDFFYPAVGTATIFALMLIAGGLRPGPKRAPAYVRISAEDEFRRRDGRR